MNVHLLGSKPIICTCENDSFVPVVATRMRALRQAGIAPASGKNDALNLFLCPACGIFRGLQQMRDLAETPRQSKNGT